MRRAWLTGSGVLPYRCRLFHSLNQRLDSKFPRSVATFHDIFVITGDYSTPEFRARFAQQAREAAARADLLIAVSEFTANQVSDVLSVHRSRIRVIYHGVNPPAATPPPDAERRNLVLHVGALQKRKNLSRLVEAFEHMPPDWELVLAGSAGFGSEEILDRIARSPRRAGIRVTGYVSQDELDHLYATARVFAFPSLDEGFGMPVLDAMARRVPVLTSSTSSLGEIAGNAAILVDPHSAESIASGLWELTSESTRERYRVAGDTHVRRFSWRHAVDQTWEVYRELLD